MPGAAAIADAPGDPGVSTSSTITSGDTISAGWGPAAMCSAA
jgi:hypothetical protein